jgi:hypothetical protein
LLQKYPLKRPYLTINIRYSGIFFVLLKLCFYVWSFAPKLVGLVWVLLANGLLSAELLVAALTRRFAPAHNRYATLRSLLIIIAMLSLSRCAQCSSICSLRFATPHSSLCSSYRCTFAPLIILRTPCCASLSLIARSIAALYRYVAALRLL